MWVGLAAALLIGGVGLLIVLGVFGSDGSKDSATPTATSTASTGSPHTSEAASSTKAEPTTTKPVDPALVTPKMTIEQSCVDVAAGADTVSVPRGFDALDPDADDQYAHVVEVDGSTTDLLASVRMATGKTEMYPTTGRLIAIGANSTVVVCVSPDESKPEPAMICQPSPTSTTTATSPEYLTVSPKRYSIQAFELSSGARLGDDVIEATVTGCPSGYVKLDTPDVELELARLDAESRTVIDSPVSITDEEPVEWTVQHLRGGVYE